MLHASSHSLLQRRKLLIHLPLQLGTLQHPSLPLLPNYYTPFPSPSINYIFSSIHIFIPYKLINFLFKLRVNSDKYNIFFSCFLFGFARTHIEKIHSNETPSTIYIYIAICQLRMEVIDLFVWILLCC